MDSQKDNPFHPLTKDEVRRILTINGFTVKPGQKDLKDYVFQAASKLLHLAAQRAYKEGADQVHTNLVIRASNHFHGNPSIHEKCAEESALVLMWSEEAVESAHELGRMKYPLFDPFRAPLPYEPGSLTKAEIADAVTQIMSKPKEQDG